MYLSWRTKQRKFSPLGAKHHFLLLFCPPVRLHLHKREMGLYLLEVCVLNAVHVIKCSQGQNNEFKLKQTNGIMSTYNDPFVTLH